MAIKNDKKEIINYLLENESAFGILVAILLFGSQNLQILSANLSKKPNSLIYHIQKLSEYHLLEIDNKKSTLPGKYYNVTEFANEIINSDLLNFIASIEGQIKESLEDKDKNLDSIPNLLQIFTGILSFVKIMSNLWLIKMEPEKLSIRDGKFYKGEKQVGPSQLMINILDVTDKTDDEKILTIIKKFSEDLETAEKEIKEKKGQTQPMANKEYSLFGDAKKFRFLYIFSALFDRE